MDMSGHSVNIIRVAKIVISWLGLDVNCKEELKRCRQNGYCEYASQKGGKMILGSPLIDALAFVAIGWTGAFLLLPLGQLIDYKRDCKKHGKKQADEIWRRMR